MKNTPQLWILKTFIFAAFFMPGYVFAASPENQLSSDRYVASYPLFNFGTTTVQTTVTSISLILSATSTPTRVALRIICLNNNNASPSECSSPSNFLSLGWAEGTPLSGDKQFTTFYFATSSLKFLVGKIYLAEVLTIGTGTLTGVYGRFEPFLDNAGYCTYGGNLYCIDRPYTQFNSAIDWSAISFPLVYDSNAQDIAASSSLWGNYTASSTLATIGNCALSGNFFSEAICSAFAYLFSPDTGLFAGFSDIPGFFATKFPFSWIIEVYSVFGGYEATTTEFPVGTMNLQSLGVGSTTSFGNVLPSVTFFSSSTMMTYMPSGVWDSMQALMRASLWLSLFAYVFNYARNRFSSNVLV